MKFKHILLVGMLLLAAVAGTAAVASAQDDPEDAPGAPASFYGAVEDDEGVPAAAGTTIYAVAIDSDGDTSVEGSIEVEPEGQYGDEDGDKLRVDSNAGDEVRFHAGEPDGPESDTYDLEAGVFEQDLTFPAGSVDPPEEDDPDDTGNGNGGGAGAPGAGTGDGGISVDTPDIDDDLGDDAEITNEDERIIDVDPDTGTSSVTMSQESNVVSIVFSDLDVEGTVNVRNIEGTPAATGSPPGDTATTSFITVPEQVRDSSATVTKRISADRLDELDASADQLVVQRYSNGEWSNLDTEVASESDSEVTVEAETPGFSYFAVSAVDEEPDDDEPVEAPDEDGIGMTALIGLVVVIALIAVAAVAYRQLNDDGGDSNF